MLSHACGRQRGRESLGFAQEKQEEDVAAAGAALQVVQVTTLLLLQNHPIATIIPPMQMSQLPLIQGDVTRTFPRILKTVGAELRRS